MKKVLLTFILTLCCALFVFTSKAVNANEETVIEAFAHYEFNDPSNPGKDSSKHGFDLIQKSTSGSKDAFQMLVDETDGDGYASIRRDQYENGASKGYGAYLYAPQQGTSSLDFSDMIAGSYTVSFTFRSDNSIGHGDVYALTFGRYTSCLTIVPWKNGMEIQLINLEFADGETNDEKQSYCEANKRFYPYSTADWTNITITANADDNLYCVYMNGELIDEIILPGVKLTSSNYDDYSFAIGAQCNIYGNSATQFGNVDVKDLAIYDCALSEENVERILAGDEAILEKQSGNTVYVESIEQLDSTTIDLEITDVNTLDELMTNCLPDKAKVKTTNGVERNYPVYWYEAADQTIKGYIQCGFINPSLQEIELHYDYVAKFDYDDSNVTLKNVKLDGSDYVPGTAITPNKHLLSFEVELAAGAVLNSVSYFGMEFEAEDGVYYIDVVEGALIVIDAEVEKYTVTYMDGEEKLSTSKYTANGNEALKEFTKEGYIFVGWYKDAALTEEFKGLDYANPTDITLYAKWELIPVSGGNDDGGNNDDSKSGCGGSVISSLFGLGLLTAGLIVVKKRKENE